MVRKATELRGQRPRYGKIQLMDIRKEFERIAGDDGVLGDPNGPPAYAYIRVSSEAQSEDGKSGLPRQILHIHEKAKEVGACIPWDMVFADAGYSGFSFRNRPALTRLRQEVKTRPRAKRVFFEHLDRLSRNARWHQGYLLDEFEKAGIELVFWKPYGSEIERAVLGTISEQGMRMEIERMRDGYLDKARRGWVVAKRPAYGYMFVDAEGKPKDNSRGETYYALHPEQSKVMRMVYEKLIYEGWTLYKLADWMNEHGIPTRFSATSWSAATLAPMVRNELYKGELYANRWMQVDTGEYREDGRPKRKMVQRPREEWILIKVPPIVTPEEWKLAQKTLRRNMKVAKRNMRKRKWLLSGFVRCALDGYSYVAQMGGTRRKPIRYYGCRARFSNRAKDTGEYCRTPYIRADFLEQLVWSKIAEIIYDPELVISYLEKQYSASRREELEQELAYLNEQLEDMIGQKLRWREAYLREVIDLEEFEAYRSELAARANALEQEKAQIIARLEGTVDLEEQKRVVLSGLERLKAQIEGQDLPFELKRQILTLLVDDIWINGETKEMRIEGVIRENILLESPDALSLTGSMSR